MSTARRVVRVSMWIGAGVLWALTALGLRFALGLPAGAEILLVLPLPIGIAALPRHRRRIWLAAAAVAVLTFVLIMAQQPRNDRDWWPELAQLASVEMGTGSQVALGNVRAFEWRTRNDYDVHWRERVIDLDEVRTVDLLIQPFAGLGLFAHAMLSFGFEDGYHLLLSVEARKEKHEVYGLLPGLFRQYELAYILADESDMLALRAGVDGSEIYLFPARGSSADARALLVDILQTIDRLEREPVFYNSLRSNCTTVLLDHADRVSRQNRYTYQVLFPGLAGEWMDRFGLLATDLPYGEVRERFAIGARIREHLGAPDFSQRIRAGLPINRGHSDKPRSIADW